MNEKIKNKKIEKNIFYNKKYKKYKKIISSLVIISLLIILNFKSITAIGVSPDKIIMKAIPNGYSQSKIIISNQGTTSFQTILKGDHPEWFNISGKNNLERKTELIIEVNVPPDAQSTIYNQKLYVIENRISLNELMKYKTGNSLDLSISIPITLIVNSTEKSSCISGGLRIPDFEEGEKIYFEYQINNNGNTRITPKGSINIIKTINDNIINDDNNNNNNNNNGENANNIYFGTFTGQEVLPTTTNKNFVEKYVNLEPGNYLLKIYVDECKQELTKRFKVLEKGSITKRGELINIESPNEELKKNNLIPIKAKFKNIGDRPVNAKFSGIIEKENKIVKVIDTETIMVEAGKTINLESFFNPTEEGTYTLKGKIIYDNKQSSEIEKKFIIKKDETSLEITIATSMLIIFLIIILLMVKIIDKKKKKSKKI